MSCRRLDQAEVRYILLCNLESPQRRSERLSRELAVEAKGHIWDETVAMFRAAAGLFVVTE